MQSRLLMKTLFAAAATAAATAHAGTVTVFADDFEDGSVADWTVSASAGVITPVVELRTDSVHAGSGALWTYFDAPDGGTGANFVHASHDFFAAAAGDYTLDLWARSAPCGGCTMHFDVLLDGVLLARDGSSQNAYSAHSYSFNALSAGTHTLTLGMYTDGASSGRFQASFDDVRISTDLVGEVPEPGTLPLLLLAGGAALAQRRKR